MTASWPRSIPTPWAALAAELEPFYPKGKGRGRPPIGLERMLRMYVAQQCFGRKRPGITPQRVSQQCGSSSARALARCVGPRQHVLPIGVRIMPSSALTGSGS